MGIERPTPPAAPSITTSHNPSPPLSSLSTPSLSLAHHESRTKLTPQAIGTHPSAPERILASSAACSITSQSLSTPSVAVE
ncbi:hypothetical protein D9619_004306 [Psilocybe cf. subviscida]|uniref:Uncharacterized protein n=1 Tax=Psilocybe cf. subviscida TaxID=2480587 RepID=A0A8H5BQV3_9AGAR|nr:hypothetical protein D9619_004306 [Psilocybe cf. subviscida]